MKLFRRRIKPKNAYSTVSAWLGRVCKNDCVSRLRKRMKEQPGDSDLLDIELIPSLHNEYGAAEQASDIKKVIVLLDSLNIRERQVIKLRYLVEETMSNKEIAQALEIREPAATMLHKSAIRKLRQCLGLPPDDNVESRRPGTQARSI